MHFRNDVFRISARERAAVHDTLAAVNVESSTKIVIVFYRSRRFKYMRKPFMMCARRAVTIIPA